MRLVNALQHWLGASIVVHQKSAHVLEILISKPNSEEILHLLFYGAKATERIPHEAETGPHPIHIDADLWVQKPEIILSRIKAKLGLARKIHARETQVARIDKAQAMNFQMTHHLQVALPGKYRYGLFLQGELVAVAVFSGGRKMKSLSAELRSFELLRFCHKTDLIVVGGLSKLLRSFEKEFSPGDIMTYIDRDWSDGKSFERIGFEKAGDMPPQEFWLDSRTHQRYTAFDLPEPAPSLEKRTAEEDGTAKLEEPHWIQKENAGSLKMIKRK